eukprot:2811678-Lingulodinium_polyedra.AAC.1
MTWVIPERAPSGDAECWAAKMALDILERMDLPLGPVTIVGDNLGVVRYCADTGRLRNHTAHCIMDE